MTPSSAERLSQRLRVLRIYGRTFQVGTTAVAVGVLVFVVAFAALLVQGAFRSITHYGLSFFTNTSLYAGPLIVGTLLVSGLALLFAVPVALGVAIFASELAPRWLRSPLAYVLDLGATIPSIVYGFWAIEVVVPWMEYHVEPRLGSLTGGGFPFSGHPLGHDYLVASLVLAVMIIPTISALTREALRAIPRAQREAVLSLGGTRWDATRISALGPASPGIVAAVMLGLGRAIGETIVVALLLGNIYVFPTSLFSQGGTIPSLLINQFQDSFGLQESVLLELGVILFALSFAINLGARLLIGRLERGASPGHLRWRRHAPPTSLDPARAGPADSLGEAPWWDRAVAHRARALRRRKVVYAVVVVLLLAAVAAAVVPLASLIATAVQQGGAAVATPSFYVSEPPPFCLQVNASTSCPLGGIGPAIQGTLILLGLAALIAVPAGLLTGIYLSEYGRRNRFGRLLGLLVDVMVGVPSILLGVFVFSVFLSYDHADATSALAGGVALALLMLPIVARATEVALHTVPTAVREAALALGFPRHRVTTRVVLGNSKAALVTGNLLALGRAGGETAALVLTAGSSPYWFDGLNRPVAALGPLIYYDLTVASAPNWTADAWGAALVLLLIMAGVSLAARWTLRTESAEPV